MKPPVALRYMLDFECAGAACEDTCCGGWEIPIGQGPYAKLKRVLEKDAKAGLLGDPSTLIELTPPEERTRERFAVIRQNEAGSCPLLDAERLCSLQRRHGAALLPEVCSMFPRTYRRVGERLELSGSFSCPEVVRRAVLTEGATDLHTFKLSVPERVAPPVDDPVRVHIADNVRTVLYDLMSRREHALTSTFLFVTWLAYRTDPLFHPADGKLDDVAITDALIRFSEPAQLAELEQRFAAVERVRTDALPLIEVLLGHLLEARTYKAFHQLVDEVRASYADVADDKAALARTFAARRATVIAAHGDAVDLYMRNFARHYVVKNWPNNDGSLKHCIQGLLIRVAVMRFLLLSHPAAAAAAGSADRTALDKVAVRVIYALARHIEHTPTLLVQLTTFVAEQLKAIESAVALLCL